MSRCLRSLSSLRRRLARLRRASPEHQIFAFNYGKGSASIRTGFGSSINSGGTGLNAGNQATSIFQGSGSTVTVVARGTINSGINNNNSGSAPAGILAGYNPGGLNQFNANVFGDVFIYDSANLIAAAGDGINSYNYGTGDISVTFGFGVSIQALTSANSVSGNGKSPFGIAASNYGHGDIHVTMAGGTASIRAVPGSTRLINRIRVTPDATFAGHGLFRRVDSLR